MSQKEYIHSKSDEELKMECAVKTTQILESKSEQNSNNMDTNTEIDIDIGSESSEKSDSSGLWFELNFVSIDDRIRFDLLCKCIVILTLLFVFSGVVNFFSSFYPVILHLKDLNGELVETKDNTTKKTWPVDVILLMANVIAIDISSTIFIISGFLSAYLHSSMQKKDSMDMIKIVAIYMMIDIFVAYLCTLIFGSIFHLIHHSFQWKDFALTFIEGITALSLFEWNQFKTSWHSWNPTAWPALCLLYAHSLTLYTISSNQRMARFGKTISLCFMFINCAMPIFVISLFALLNDDTNIFFTNSTNLGYRLFEFNCGVFAYLTLCMYKHEGMYYTHILSSVSYPIFSLFIMMWFSELGAPVAYSENTCVRMYYFSPCIKFHHGFLMRGCLLGLTLIARFLNIESTKYSFRDYSNEKNMDMDPENKELTIELVQSYRYKVYMPLNIQDCVSLFTFTWPVCYIINLLLEINFGYNIIQQNSSLLVFVLPHIISLFVYIWNRLIKIHLFHWTEKKMDMIHCFVASKFYYSSSQ